MMNQIIINNKQLNIIEYQNTPVITAQMIADVHEKPVLRVNEQFNRNRKYFVENEDFFKIAKSDPKIANCDFKNLFTGKHQKEVYLFTESGYLMLTKTFRDDISWKVQRVLVNSYFKLRDMNNDFSDPFKNLGYALLEMSKEFESVKKRLTSLESTNNPDAVWVTAKVLAKALGYMEGSMSPVCRREKVITKNEYSDGGRRNYYLVNSMPRRWQERLKEKGVIK